MGVVARRLSRWLYGLGVFLGAGAVLLLSACTIPPVYLYLTVNTAADGADAVAGDGVCEMTRGVGDCSLRAAIDEANATVGKVPWIKVPGGWYDLQISGVDDSNRAGDLDLAPAGGSVTIEALQPALIAANGEDRVFDIRSGTVSVKGLSVTSATTAGITVRAGSTLNLTHSSVTSNAGAGIEVDATATALVDNSTIGENGGIGVRNDGRFEALFSTIYENRSGGVAGSAIVTLEASIIGSNNPGTVCGVGVVSRGYNFTTDLSCNLSQPTDSAGTPAGASLSGLNQRYFVFYDRVLVDAIPAGAGPCPASDQAVTDQLGGPRPAGNGCDRGAIDTNRHFRVTSSADARDQRPGDGVCDAGGGACTLRAAITEANSTPGRDTVEVAPGVNPSLTITGPDDNANTYGDLDITEQATIDGGGATVDARGISRVFDARIDTEFEDLTIRGGNAGSGEGGGIRGGYLWLRRVRVTGNTASTGGGVYATELSMDSSTVDGNTATTQAGGVRTGGYSTITNSTLTGNSSPSGAAIYAPGSGPIASLLEFSTITGNRGSASIAGGGWKVAASILSSLGTDNCAGSGFQSQGWNLTTDASCGLSTSTDRVWQHPLLHPLASNGGSTPTALLASDSPAKDAIPVGSAGFCDRPLPDQRGVARPQGSGCDIGAVEGAGAPLTLPPLLVDAGGDTRDPTPGDGVCGSGVGTCTLRAAIDESNAVDLPHRVVIAPGISPRLSRPGVNEDNNATGDLDVVGYLTLDGGGASVDGARLDRVLHKLGSGNGWLRLENVTVTGGELSTSGALGGGIKSDGGRVELVNVVIDGNRIAGAGSTKGAGAFLGAGPVSVERSTISANSGASAGGGFFVAAGPPAYITDSTFAGNSASTGGAIATETSLTLEGSTVTGNTAPGSAAVTSLVSANTLLVSNSVVRANTGRGVWAATAALDGSLVENNSEGGVRIGNGTVRRSTVRLNTASYGAGLYVEKSTVIESSTINDNVATNAGGAAFLMPTTGSLTVNSSTLFDNRAPVLSAVSGTVVLRYSTIIGRSPTTAMFGNGTLRSSASIISSRGGKVCDYSNGVSDGFNLVTDNSCGLSASSDLVGQTPIFHPLADNGGPTATTLLASGSPGIDAIPVGTTGLCDSSAPTDQRGVARPAGSGCDIGAVEGVGPRISSLKLVVDTSADGMDVNPGDGICRTSTGGCTLRAAITESNLWPTVDQITIATGVNPVLSIPGSGEDWNATGDLDVWDSLTLRGSSSVVSAAGLDRVFHHQGGSLTIEGLEITGGQLTVPAGQIGQAEGAGIYSIGNLVVRNSWVHDNSATSQNARGGGIYSAATLPVRIEGTTVSGNVVSGTGAQAGGIYADGAAGVVKNSTFSDNAVSGNLSTNAISDVWLSGTMRFSTVSGRGPRPIIKGGAGLNVKASVISNSTGPACDVGLASGGWNVATGTTCALTASGDLQSSEPYLFPLAANGGPTPTRLPAANSVVIDRVPVGTAGLCDGAFPTDQRGWPRPAGGACDVGAVEGSGPAAVALNLTVNTAADEPDASPGDLTCQTASGMCSLRAAITEANLFPNQADTITIAPGVHPVLSIPGQGEDGNRTGDLDIDGSVTIVGNGARIDGAGIDTVIHQTFGTLTLQDLTLTGGSGPDAGAVVATKPLTLNNVIVSGNTGASVGGVLATNTLTITNSSFSDNRGSVGAIYAIYGTVTIRDTVFQSNQSTSTVGGGGALALYSTSTTIERVTMTGNSSAGNGGALYVNNGSVSVLQSTLSANSARTGGGMYAMGTVAVNNSTISGNVASSGSAIGAAASGTPTVTVTTSTLVGSSGSTTLVGVMRLRGTIVDAAGGPSACAAAVTSLGWNLSSDSSCGLTATGDRQSTSAQLGALANNGGPTSTHLPAAGSPAVNAIPAGTSGLCDVTNPTDQRGVARPQGAACDVGAVER